ncbi:serine/threonine protein phosphatase 2A 57 kDa regulatory subunit B' beta isoform-like [Zingiber officinale]|uniref:serine/threonine protein phosphatase 2A 57 kDa regulatory subunit B' beta isoform-like n=1 Tax=Zingiber officinale TaxID=94328 RepID=UPI001C4C4AD9|nr:serine/threonine protein phosphatase 2A 57 kDa regulatory subunit B' beta isoform-like [Zingiber officinale]
MRSNGVKPREVDFNATQRVHGEESQARVHLRDKGADPSSPCQLHSSPTPGAVPQIESLPLFPNVPFLERQALFLGKRICSVLFDFSDTLKSAREKEVKRQTLSELVDFVQSGSDRLNEQVQEELVRLCLHKIDSV